MNTLGTFRLLAGRLTSEGAFVAFALYSLAGVFAQAAAAPLTSAVTHFSDYSIGENLLATGVFHHGALCRVLPCRAASDRREVHGYRDLVALLAFGLGGRNDVRGADPRWSHPGIRAL